MARMSSDSIGGTKCEPGKYHLMVNASEECTSKKNTEGFKVEVEVLAGNVAGQEHKKVSSFLYAPVLWDFAAAVGMVNHVTGEAFTPAMLAEMRDPKNKGQKIDVEFRASDAVGCQFIAEIVPEYLEDKKTIKPDGWPRIGFFVCSVVDDRAKDVPKDQAMIDQLMGVSEPTGGLAGAQAYD